MRLSPFILQFEALIRRLYASLPSRDRRALIVLAVLVVSLIVWRGCWQPLEATRIAEVAAYHSTRADLTWMRAHAGEAKTLPVSSTSADLTNHTLLAVAGASAAAHEITFNNAEPGEDDSLRLSLDNVAFSHLLPWLDGLQSHDGIRATDISIERLDATPGFVSCKLTLRE